MQCQGNLFHPRGPWLAVFLVLCGARQWGLSHGHDVKLTLLLTREVRSANGSAPHVLCAGNGAQEGTALCPCQGSTEQLRAAVAALRARAAADSKHVVLVGGGSFVQGSEESAGQAMSSGHQHRTPASAYDALVHDTYILSARDFVAGAGSLGQGGVPRPPAVASNLDPHMLAQLSTRRRILPFQTHALPGTNTTLGIVALADLSGLTSTAGSWPTLSKALVPYSKALVATLASMRMLPLGEQPSVVVLVVTGMEVTGAATTAATPGTVTNTAILEQLVTAAPGVDVVLMNHKPEPKSRSSPYKITNWVCGSCPRATMRHTCATTWAACVFDLLVLPFFWQ